MILVPRQLRRVGMTGDVPYYGGRFTPAQAYAAAHPRSAVPPHVVSPVPVPVQSPAPGPDPMAALAHLLDSGVITREEYDDLRARVSP